MLKLNLQLSFKLDHICGINFYLLLCNNRRIDPIHLLIYQLFFIHCVFSLIKLMVNSHFRDVFCQFHMVKSFAINYTSSFETNKTFSSFVHRPQMIRQTKLDTNLIKTKRRTSIINFGRCFVIFVKNLLA